MYMSMCGDVRPLTRVDGRQRALTDVDVRPWRTSTSVDVRSVNGP